MLSTGLKIGSALLCIAVILTTSGCSNREERAGTADFYWAQHHRNHSDRQNAQNNNRGDDRSTPQTTATLASTQEMPSYAESGECYARVYVPPEFDTVTERVCVREASEKIEIIPAEYEWVEERVLVKEASTELVEVPAQFEVKDFVVQTSPGHATWIKADESRCTTNMRKQGPSPEDVFCLVSEPPTTRTIQTKRMVQGPKIKEVNVPPKYETIRKQKLVRPASTRKVTVPAEYREIEKTVMVTPAKLEWQRVSCDAEAFRSRGDVRPVSDRNP